MRILAIDPGPTKSGWVLLEDGVPKAWAHDLNEDIRDTLFYNLERLEPYPHLVIEDIGNYGMAVGRDVFETVRWTGRLEERWHVTSTTFIPRPTIKTHLCGVASAKDANVRQALIDRYGGDEVAIGGKKCQTCKGKGWVGRGRPPCPDCSLVNQMVVGDKVVAAIGTGYETPPGPLHGLSGHCWSALAVGVTYLDTMEERE